MHLIRKYNRISSLKVRCYLTIIPFHLQCKSVDNSRNQFVRINLFHLQSRLLTVEHRHLKHFFHLETQPLGFIINDSRYMLEHLWRFTYRRIFQHLCRQGNGRYRCLKFMCHIIDKVILHLRQLLLPEYDINRKDKCHQQYQRKYQRRNHEAHRIKEIIPSPRKMNFQNTRLCRWIILKQCLLISLITSFLFIVRTTINTSSFFIKHFIMERQIYTIIIQIRLQITVQIPEPNPFSN